MYLNKNLRISIFNNDHAELLQDQVQLFAQLHLLLVNHVMEQPATWNQFLQFIGSTQFLIQLICSRCKNEEILADSHDRVSYYFFYKFVNLVHFLVIVDFGESTCAKT